MFLFFLDFCKVSLSSVEELNPFWSQDFTDFTVGQTEVVKEASKQVVRSMSSNPLETLGPKPS